MPPPDRVPADPPESGSPASGAPSWLDPLFSDPGLWPLLCVLSLSLVTVGAALLLLAVSERRPSALLALLLVAGVSVEGVLRHRRARGRLGRVGWLVIALWAASGGVAAIVVATGIF